jgi:hypothetical protein
MILIKKKAQEKSENVNINQLSKKHYVLMDIIIYQNLLKLKMLADVKTKIVAKNHVGIVQNVMYIYA